MINNYISVLTKYTDFTGRASRTEFWLFQLANLIIIGVALLAANIIPGAAIILLVIMIAYLLGTLVPSIAVTVRRLHDTSRSGWWILIAFVPYIGSLVLLVFEVLDSTPGDNIYGPHPYGVAGNSSTVNEESSDTEVIEVEEVTDKDTV